MARKPLVHVPRGIYHVMLRGNGGQEIFSAAEDREEIYRLRNRAETFQIESHQR